MLSALLLAMPALTGNVSVLQTVGETSTEATPAPALDANSNVDANANVDTNANVNVETNTNTATNANVPTNTNATSKIDEPKPPQTEPANK